MLRRFDPYVSFLAVVAAAFIWSAIRPKDYGVWIFELSLGLVAVALLVATRRRYPFSGLAYGLAAVHFVILACGARYTYAGMPLFNWLRDVLDLSRNDFDRVGHLAQGFIPAIFVRELLRRTGALRPGPLLGVLTVSVCLAFSALYEILEWWMVVAFYPSNAPEWLGMQRPLGRAGGDADGAHRIGRRRPHALVDPRAIDGGPVEGAVLRQVQPSPAQTMPACDGMMGLAADSVP